MSGVLSPCACMALRKAARAVSRFYDEALAPAGLTVTQFALLRNVATLGDPPLSRLAEALVMDRTSLYRTLQPMVRAGWLAIEAGQGRTKRAALQPAGRARLAAAEAHWDAAQGDFIQRFGSEAWRDVEGGLKRAIEVVEA
jgi:DNA-binding MarR family transcriptional regulator